MTEVFRQAAESRIIVNAHGINQGLLPNLAPVEGGDFYFVEASNPEEPIRMLLTIVRKRIPKRFLITHYPHLLRCGTKQEHTRGFCGFERWRATRCNFKRGSERPSLLFFTEQRISAGRR